MAQLPPTVPQDVKRTCGTYEPFGFHPARYYNADGLMLELPENRRLFCLPSTRLLEWRLIGPRCSTLKKGTGINKTGINSFQEALRAAKTHLERTSTTKEDLKA